MLNVFLRLSSIVVVSGDLGGDEGDVRVALRVTCVVTRGNGEPRMVTKVEKTDSFFKFFLNPVMYDDQDEDDDDDEASVSSHVSSLEVRLRGGGWRREAVSALWR